MADLAPVHVQPEGDALNELFTLDDVKDHLQRAGTQDDERINRLIGGVTDTVEIALRRPVRKRQYQAFFSRPPTSKDVLLLPYTPVISIEALASLQSGVWVDVPVLQYRANRLWSSSQPPPVGPVFIEPADMDDGWDEIEYDKRLDPFRVSYTAGWDPVPGGIVDAAIRLCADRFVLKGTLIDVEQYRAGTVVQTMLMQYRAPAGIRFIHR